MSDDNELFELCKEVYERTGYETGEWTNDSGGYVSPASDLIEAGIHFPLYTSDYLLEKLPRWYFDTDIEETMVLALMPHMLETDKWIARYETPEHRASEFEAIAGTPLKALLKLVIALDNSGVELQTNK